MRININVDLANTITQRESLIALRHEAPDLFDNLVFEITEEVLCEIDEENLKALYKLSIDGAKLSIDDFGIGKSGFARLSPKVSSGRRIWLFSDRPAATRCRAISWRDRCSSKSCNPSLRSSTRLSVSAPPYHHPRLCRRRSVDKTQAHTSKPP
ncbi:MAG: EAL domain-containing protein [Nitratireductor sp.]|nr:EAL domain-containing protein [Nitratireductor sp.]